MECKVDLDCLIGQSGLSVACRNCAIACYGLHVCGNWGPGTQLAVFCCVLPSKAELDVGRNKSLWTQLRHGVPRWAWIV